MTMSAIGRGFINPFRNKARAVVVVMLLSLVTGFLALMVQATESQRERALQKLQGFIDDFTVLARAGG